VLPLALQQVPPLVLLVALHVLLLLALVLLMLLMLQAGHWAPMTAAAAGSLLLLLLQDHPWQALPVLPSVDRPSAVALPAPARAWLPSCLLGEGLAESPPIPCLSVCQQLRKVLVYAIKKERRVHCPWIA
jgi:hypothetical protein